MKKKRMSIKLGGGSIKDAESVRHIPKILSAYSKEEVVLVLSAFGGQTNDLELLAKAFHKSDPGLISDCFEKVESFHKNITEQLFPKNHHIFTEVSDIFDDIQEIGSTFGRNFKENLLSDQIMPYGEILSSKIISEHLKLAGVEHHLIHAYDLVKTNSQFTEAEINEESTFENIKTTVPKFLEHAGIVVTQGFIGSFELNLKSSHALKVTYRTTLERESSDYSAAIFAYPLDADAILLLKNVPGIMDKNPNIPGGENAKLLKKLSYERAKELLLSGTAKGIVHPKTIELAERKKIPIVIKPFWNLEAQGTVIS